MNKSAGIHHITGITGDAKKNYGFYTKTLGLRFVKRTVNFDDPSAWHLYYGNETGAPGSALTFFLWQNMPRGQQGMGEAVEVGYAVPKGSLGFWKKRLDTEGIASSETERFGDKVLFLQDLEGMKIEIVETATAANAPAWGEGSVPLEHAVRGFSGITLRPHGGARTAEVLTKGFGYADGGKEREKNGDRQRFLGDADIGAHIDIVIDKDQPRGSQGAGTLHHVAFRAKDDDEEIEIANRIRQTLGINTTEQINRMYFHSVYFREPGGILFEIATDKPGFTWDEPKESLGSSLKLPPWFEKDRERIAAALPPLE
ncbi:MAG: ring-cleaving dioxygenase [Xanthobacteraceae bacterium]|nr:ring-cleaving dioxygenase [Xanthobacteraceae bacterium]QYK43852.1 MAG: ring-cleaving dioxygenase [Xanthobacteraceae bacterium]